MDWLRADAVASHGKDLPGKGIKLLLGHGFHFRYHTLYGGPSGNQTVSAFLLLSFFIILLALFQPLGPVPVLPQFGLVLGVLPPTPLLIFAHVGGPLLR